MPGGFCPNARIPGVFVVDSCLPFVVYATNSPVNQKYLTVIYSCIYNNQPTNNAFNTFIYFPNKCLYQVYTRFIPGLSIPYSPFFLGGFINSCQPFLCISSKIKFLTNSLYPCPIWSRYLPNFSSSSFDNLIFLMLVLFFAYSFIYSFWLNVFTFFTSPIYIVCTIYTLWPQFLCILYIDCGHNVCYTYTIERKVPRNGSFRYEPKKPNTNSPRGP